MVEAEGGQEMIKLLLVGCTIYRSSPFCFFMALFFLQGHATAMSLALFFCHCKLAAMEGPNNRPILGLMTLLENIGFEEKKRGEGGDGGQLVRHRFSSSQSTS